jgi:ABC-2 type transport system permease protein
MIRLLLITRLKSFLNFLRFGGKTRLVTVVIISIVLLALVMIGFLGKVLRFAVSNPEIGTRLIDSITALSIHGIFILMCFYGLSYAVYSVFFGTDLELLLSLPIKKRDIFLYKVIEAAFFNTRVSLVFVGPALIIAGIFYGASAQYYLLALVIILVLTAIPGSLGIMAAAFIARKVSRSKIRNALAITGAGIGLLIWGGFNLFNRSFTDGYAAGGGPDAYMNMAASRIWTYIPSGWASLAALGAARGSWPEAAFYMAVLLICASILTFLAYKSISWYFAAGVTEEFSRPAGSRLFSIKGGNSPLWAHLRRDFIVIFREVNALTQSVILLIFLIIFPFLTGSPKGGESLPLSIPPASLIFANILGCQFGSRLIPLERTGFWLNLVTPSGPRYAVLSKSIIGFVLCSSMAIIVGSIHLAGGITAEINYVLFLASFSWAGFGLGMAFSAYFSDFGWENPNRMLKMAGLIMYLLSMAGVMLPMGIAAFLAGEVFPGIINPGLLVVLFSTGIVLLSYLISARKISNFQWETGV